MIIHIFVLGKLGIKCKRIYDFISRQNLYKIEFFLFLKTLFVQKIHISVNERGLKRLRFFLAILYSI